MGFVAGLYEEAFLLNKFHQSSLALQKSILRELKTKKDITLEVKQVGVGPSRAANQMNHTNELSWWM